MTIVSSRPPCVGPIMSTEPATRGLALRITTRSPSLTCRTSCGVIAWPASFAMVVSEPRVSGVPVGFDRTRRNPHGCWDSPDGAEGARTPDLRAASATLSQLSYSPKRCAVAILTAGSPHRRRMAVTARGTPGRWRNEARPSGTLPTSGASRSGGATCRGRHRSARRRGGRAQGSWALAVGGLLVRRRRCRERARVSGVHASAPAG